MAVLGIYEDFIVAPLEGYSERVKDGSSLMRNEFLLRLIASTYFDEVHYFSYPDLISQKALVEYCKGVTLHFHTYDDLYEILKIIDFNAFYVPTPMDMNRLTPLRAKAEKHFPFFSLVHTLSSHELLPGFLGLFLNNQIQENDCIFCSSQAGKMFLESLFTLFVERTGSKRSFPGKFEVIHSGVDAQSFSSGDKKKARDELSLPDRFIFLSFGRMSSFDKSDAFVLLRSFSRLLKECKALLVFAGSDPFGYSKTIMRYAEHLGIGDSVMIHSNVPQRQKILFYQTCDCFVSLPDNLQETFGIANLEAMACGKPVICSDWNGYKETVVGEVGIRIPTYWHKADSIHSPSAWLFGPRFNHFVEAESVIVDEDKLFAAMKTLAGDPALCLKYGKNARKHVEHTYDWEHILPQYLRILERLGKGTYSRSYGSYPAEALFFDLFSHYPTDPNYLQGKSFQITERGKDVDFEDFIEMFGFSPLKSFLPVPLLKSLRGHCMTPCSYSDLAPLSDRTAYCLLWMLKQGFLKAAS